MTPMKQPAAKIGVGLGAAVFLGVAVAWGQANSHARIVRLSFVEGSVTVQRSDNADWAEAPANTPLQEGFKLSTAESGFAEIEFEDGSAARLGQLSVLEFTQLALASDGSKINCLTLPQGYATFHAAPLGQDVYEVRTPNGTVTPRGKAVFRVDVESSGERVEVFHGSVDVASSLGSWTLAKNSVLELSPDSDQPYELSEGITKDDWDKWVQERESRAEAAQNGPTSGAYSNNGSGTVYGWSDLSYYGSWSYLPGFGYGWMPAVFAGWYPFSFGQWCWYPGFGYTWISFDAWGWLPYHYGWWTFVPGMGWMWFPGSFGAWSPGLVTWYMGPGWIGWMPQTNLANGNKNPCTSRQPCGTAISTGAFQSGRVVRSDTILPVDLASGKRIERPEILPDRQAMLPGRIVPQPAGFDRIEPILKAARGTNLGSQTINREPATPAPGAAAGLSHAEGKPAIGAFIQHAAPGPRSAIVYDQSSGLYVNDPRTAPGATQATGEFSIRPLPLVPESSGLRAVEPSSETLPAVGTGAAPQGHGAGWFHHASPRADSSLSATSRNGGAAPSSHTTSGSTSKGAGETSGASGSAAGSVATAAEASGSASGGSAGGGSHAGGGSGSGSGSSSSGGSSSGGHH